MAVLDAAGIPFLVGGAFALRAYTGIVRDTKDFDLMLRRGDVHAALAAFRREGLRAGIVFPHWLAKVHRGEVFLDLIYNSGNGVCPVDDAWFTHARPAEVLGRRARLCPAEEMIWQKAYIMERERFDGADVAHLVRACHRELDWERLIQRFDGDAPVLLAHLLLVRFIYPGATDLVPPWVFDRLHAVPSGGDPSLCNGPLLSRAQYLPDIERWGNVDGRVARGVMTQDEVYRWTEAIEGPGHATA